MEYVISLLIESKKLLLVSAVLAFLASVLFSMLQPEIYRAEALLIPTETRQSNSQLLGQLGSAANLIGIDIDSQNSSGVTSALATMQSREFILKFISKHELGHNLLATVWDRSERKLVIDSRKFDIEKMQWRESIPTDLALFRELNSALSISLDRINGLVTVAIEWPDPIQASVWTNLLIEEINLTIKERDLNEAKSAIAFLEAQLAKTPLLDMQRIFYQLIETQMRVVMLADARKEYAFQVIDPAVPPDFKIRPRRSLIVMLGTGAGVLLSLLFVLGRNFYDTRKFSSSSKSVQSQE